MMVSHATVPGLTTGPASLSSAAINGYLRARMGFHGLVLTDSLTAGAVSQAGYSVPGAAVAAVQAGADMVMFGSTLTPQQVQQLAPSYVAQSLDAIVNAVVAAVQNGNLPASRLDDAVLHVLGAKGVDPCALSV
jgi:beta-N-acetylhexosaminidase